MRLSLLFVTLAVLAAAPVHADDATEIAFWNSVKDSGSAAELQAYIDAYPRGEFTALARLRLSKLGAPSVVDATPTLPAATVKPTQPEFRAIDRVGVEVDAAGLSNAANLRLTVVPQGQSDAVNADDLAANSLAIDSGYARLSLPPAPSGEDEVRLYAIPADGDKFVVAARAPVRIAPPQPNSILFTDLDRDAAALGRVGFEAKYRGQTIRVEGAFSQIATNTTSPGWEAFLAQQPTLPIRYVELSIGEGGPPKGGDIPPDELICLMPAEDNGTLQRLARLGHDDDIVLTGEASVWTDVGLVMNPCAFGN